MVVDFQKSPLCTWQLTTVQWVSGNYAPNKAIASTYCRLNCDIDFVKDSSQKQSRRFNNNASQKMDCKGICVEAGFGTSLEKVDKKQLCKIIFAR